ncbi:hypothetical protein [Vibrio parahaemolyticus]|uniref:hypothetical protein n=1 Tax=Vibrio parahaemolyticus TaxID=670 RepID=UPI0007DC13BC|nr:hypothetical protein [Vibrio parahaemolyticus]OAR45769.1 hypothetical protein EM55_023630 [Vibrio parahaemolyticus]
MERDEVEKIIENKISLYRNLALAFIAGLMTISAVGYLYPQHILLPIIEGIYPTEYIFEKNKKRISSDSDLISDLFSDSRKKTVLEDLKDHQIDGVKLKTFPELSKEIPHEVWETIKSGNKEKFDEIMSQEFSDALRDKFFRDMQIAFATDNPLKYEFVENEVERYGSTELKANLTTVSSQHQGKSTSCNINFDHDDLAVIIVLPRSINREKLYKWLDCPSSEFPYTELTIRLKNGVKVSQIKVVGVEATGHSGLIELRLSKSAAIALELNNADSYLASGTGKFVVSRASFDW